MRETKVIEFKETITNTFLKTVSAFSNYDGGEFFLGIDDAGNIKGVSDIKQACLDIENRINDSISPQPNYTLEIQNNDKTIKLTVKSGVHKPYLYKSKAYKRNDTATIEVDTLEFSRLILEGKNIRFEELPYKEQDLTFEVLQQKLKESIQIKICLPWQDSCIKNNYSPYLGKVWLYVAAIWGNYYGLTTNGERKNGKCRWEKNADMEVHILLTIGRIIVRACADF